MLKTTPELPAVRFTGPVVDTPKAVVVTLLNVGVVAVFWSVYRLKFAVSALSPQGLLAAAWKQYSVFTLSGL